MSMTESRLIPLTRGYHAIVDADDYGWINQWKWSSAEDKIGLVYVIRTIYPKMGKWVSMSH